MTIAYLIEKEVKQFLRNPFLPRLVVMLPVVMLLVFPWAARQDVRNVRLAFVDLDHSVESQRLIEKTMAGGYFIGQATCGSYDEALALVQRGEADIVMQIDRGFARNLRRGESSRVMIAANAVNGTKGSLGAAYLQQIVSAFQSDMEMEIGGGGAVGMVSLSERYAFNPTLDYKRFMIPALTCMLIILLTGFLPALNIVGEKERGTIEAVNVSPVARWQFILGKLIPYWVMGIGVFSIALLLAWGVYDLAPRGSLVTLYVFALVFVSVISGFGLLVSNFSDTLQQAMFVMFFFVLVFMLMSGLFTPVTSMPSWAQTLSAFNPPRYFIEAMRMIYLKGSSLANLSRNLWLLAAFSVVFNALAVVTYKKQT